MKFDFEKLPDNLTAEKRRCSGGDGARELGESQAPIPTCSSLSQKVRRSISLGFERWRHRARGAAKGLWV